MKNRAVFVLLFGASKFRFLNDRKLSNDLRNLSKLFQYRLSYQLWTLFGDRFARPSDWGELIDQIAPLITKDDLVIIYYMGHGIELLRQSQLRYYLATPVSRTGSKKGSLELNHVINYPQERFASKAFLYVFDAYVGDLQRFRQTPYQDLLRPGTLVYLLSPGSMPNLNPGNHLQSGQSLMNYLFLKNVAAAHYLQIDMDVEKLYERMHTEASNYVSSPLQNIQMFKHSIGVEEARFPLNLFLNGLYPAEIRSNIQDDKGSREDGVIRLGQFLTESDEQMKSMARQTLRYISQTDTSNDVRVAALRTLGLLQEKTGIERETLRANFPMTRFLENVPEFISIPAGTFIMGCDDPILPSEENPEHPVFLEEYSISKTPVTNTQYAFFIADTGYRIPYHWDSVEQLRELAKYPVVNVTWYDAMAYCSWITSKLKEAGLIAPSAIIRLPTEAEWEKAARGATGLVYPWGNTFVPEYCNFTGSGNDGITPVNKYEQVASPYGCLDLAGNVWEWTISLWGTALNRSQFKYPYNPIDGRENVEADESYRRVIRGGGYYYGLECVTGYTRNHFKPSTCHSAGGFRVLLTNS